MKGSTNHEILARADTVTNTIMNKVAVVETIPIEDL